MEQKVGEKNNSKKKSFYRCLIVICIFVLITSIVMLKELSSKKEAIEEEINILSNKIENMYYFTNPTYNETVNFLKNDTTDKNIYNDTYYNCMYFSRDINNNSEQKIWICGYVRIVLKNETTGILTPHSIICYNTTDKDIVFFEPQTDEELSDLKIGMDYWTQCIKTDNNTHNDKFGFTIVEKTIFW